MPHVGTLRDYEFTQDVDDIRGAKIYGRKDEKLGEIADVIFDHSTGEIRYLVVDTGGWFTHKQFLLPANRIAVRGEDELDYRANLSREDVERFPKYDPDAVSDSDRWSKFERDYHQQTDPYFADSGVLHRADSPNIITDPDMPPRKAAREGAEPVSNADVGAAGQAPDRLEEDYVQRSEDTYRDLRMGQQLTGEFIKGRTAPENRANTSDAEIFTAEGDSIFNVADLQEKSVSPSPSVADSGATPALRDMRALQDRERLGSRIGRRWERFQNQLRTERNRATAECPHCASEWKKAA
jgi:sporulation protein YlmC with PRC-barrel domain